MSDPTTVAAEYPRRVPNTPCWVDQRGDKFVALIPVVDRSSAKTKAYEAMCLKLAKQWLRNEPEEISQIMFVLSPDSSAQVARAQERRARRARRGIARTL